MKILLYEPGTTGHRPVYLGYLAEGLPTFGIEAFVVTDPTYNGLRAEDIFALEQLAAKNSCDAIHLLTIDGAARGWLRFRRQRLASHIPIFANYYLFSNLWGLKGVFWLWARWAGYFDHLLVSDPFISERMLMLGLRRHISAVPDTWCKAEFPHWEKPVARRHLVLPSGDYIFLVFGDISQRKGIDRIIQAFQGMGKTEAKLLLVGMISPDTTHLIQCAMKESQLTERLIIRQERIPENLVSAYFYAADAILSDYPRSFLVSSGAFTRALASRTLPLLPAHGVNAKVASNIGFGIIYNSEDIGSLRGAMMEAIAYDKPVSPEVLAKIEREANQRELRNYLRQVCAAYKKLASATKRKLK